MLDRFYESVGEHLVFLVFYRHPFGFAIVAGTFTVMCYNILCDKYCTRQLYGYCPPWALNWENRKKLILEEIRHYNADIVSLQVLDLFE